MEIGMKRMPTKWTPGTTLQLTAHLWRTEPTRRGFLMTSKCGAVVTTENGVQPVKVDDHACKRCFPCGVKAWLDYPECHAACKSEGK